VAHSESSTSVPTIFVTFTALSTVAAEISERIPQILAVFTSSSTSPFKLVSVRAFLSTENYSRGSDKIAIIIQGGSHGPEGLPQRVYAVVGRALVPVRYMTDQGEVFYRHLQLKLTHKSIAR
jgi:hypothetical protein